MVARRDHTPHGSYLSWIVPLMDHTPHGSYPSGIVPLMDRTPHGLYPSWIVPLRDRTPLPRSSLMLSSFWPSFAPPRSPSCRSPSPFSSSPRQPRVSAWCVFPLGGPSHRLSPCQTPFYRGLRAPVPLTLQCPCSLPYVHFLAQGRPPLRPSISFLGMQVRIRNEYAFGEFGANSPNR